MFWLTATFSLRLFLPILLKIKPLPTSYSLLFSRILFPYLFTNICCYVFIDAFGFCLCFLLKCKRHYIRDVLFVYLSIFNAQGMPSIWWVFNKDLCKDEYLNQYLQKRYLIHLGLDFLICKICKMIAISTPLKFSEIK